MKDTPSFILPSFFVSYKPSLAAGLPPCRFRLPKGCAGARLLSTVGDNVLSR